MIPSILRRCGRCYQMGQGERTFRNDWDISPWFPCLSQTVNGKLQQPRFEQGTWSWVSPQAKHLVLVRVGHNVQNQCVSEGRKESRKSGRRTCWVSVLALTTTTANGNTTSLSNLLLTFLKINLKKNFFWRTVWKNPWQFGANGR